MSYFTVLRREAWKETWELVVESPFVTILLAVIIFGLTVFFTYLWKERKDVTDLLIDAGIGLLSTAIVFCVVFIFHFLFLSPMRLWIKAQRGTTILEATLSEWSDLFKPKIILECGSNINGSKLTIAGGHDFNSTFRIVVKSLGYNPLPNCRGNLIEISRDGKEVFGGQEAKLTFATVGHYPTFQQLDVGIPAYLEIFGLKGGTLKAAVNHHERSLGKQADEEIQKTGDYIVKIVIAALNSTSIGATLSFIWTGDFGTSHLTLIEQHRLGPVLPSQ